MQILYLIPARGGSKGIPHKNIKPLAGKPLIYYTLEVAKQLAATPGYEGIICLSTDDDAIIAASAQYGIPVAFKRPAALATDAADTYGVIRHALAHYAAQQHFFDVVVLLQPTSPFRAARHVQEALALYNPQSMDMVVSVFETKSNPYYLLAEENAQGYLVKSKQGNFTRRQDCPKVYEYNGAVYVMNVQSIMQHANNAAFARVVKYVMPAEASLDIDTPLDWEFAEFLLARSKPPQA
ncbi:acylneuraminate cytidylyltransferase family protein [Sphingobacteriales bacterium UPWRP_1]|nr:CMP-N-acetylneuraminic acid synthetase [Sphingobacteriales bacterium TSM_CSS]PSJ76697.1 acylneuraminate cytidylyltransferase family protein [Sphingobacteriales bacterium UPWRP_1]